MGPRVVRRKARASERPISRHGIEHGTISKKSNSRRKHGPKEDIVREEPTGSQRAEREVRRAIRISRGSAPGRSRYDDEHVIGSSSSGWGRSRRAAKDGKLEPKATADPALKGDDDRIMQAELQHKTRRNDGAHTHDMAKSVSE